MARLGISLTWLLIWGLGIAASAFLPDGRGRFAGFVSPNSMPWGRRAYGAPQNAYAQPRVGSFGRTKVMVMQSKDYYDILGVGRSANKQVGPSWFHAVTRQCAAVTSVIEYISFIMGRVAPHSPLLRR